MLGCRDNTQIFSLFKSSLDSGMFGLYGLNGASCIAFNSKSSFLSGQENGEIKVWTYDKYFYWMERIIGSHEQGVTCMVKVSNDLLATGSNDATIKIWNIEESKCIQTLKSESSIKKIENLGQSFFVTAEMNGLIKIWNFKSGDVSNIFKDISEENVTCLKCIDSNKLIIGYSEGTIQIFDLKDRSLIHSYKAHSNAVSNILVLYKDINCA